VSAAQYGFSTVHPFVAARRPSRFGSRSEDSKLLGAQGLYTIHGVCKNLHRSNWLARAVENCCCTYMAAPMPIGGEAQAQKVWLDWWDHAGIRGESLEDIYTQWISQQVQLGDALLLFVEDPNAKTLVRSRLQVIDSSRLRVPDDLLEAKTSRGNSVVHGVEIDARTGAEVGFWVCKTKDGAYLLGDSSNFVFYPRTDAATGRPIARLLKRPDSLSPSSTRGLGALAHVIPEVEDLGDLQGAAVQSAYTRAMLSVILTSPNPTALQGGLGVQVDDAGNPIQANQSFISGLESGSVVMAPPGTLAQQISSTGSVDVVALQTESLRHVCGALGIPLEILLSNFVNVNFSSSKNSFDKFLRLLQRWTDSNVIFLSEIYRWVTLQGLLAQGITPTEEHQQVSWSPIALPDQDQVKTASAQAMQLASGTETRSSILAKRGISYKDFLTAKKQEEALELEILGHTLDLPAEPLNVKQADQQQAAEEGAESTSTAPINDTEGK